MLGAIRHVYGLGLFSCCCSFLNVLNWVPDEARCLWPFTLNCTIFVLKGPAHLSSPHPNLLIHSWRKVFEDRGAVTHIGKEGGGRRGCGFSYHPFDVLMPLSVVLVTSALQHWESVRSTDGLRDFPHRDGCFYSTKASHTCSQIPHLHPSANSLYLVSLSVSVSLSLTRTHTQTYTLRTHMLDFPSTISQILIRAHTHIHLPPPAPDKSPS